MQPIKRSVLILLISIVWIRCSYSAEEVTGWALSDTPVVVQGGTLIGPVRLQTTWQLRDESSLRFHLQLEV